MEKRVANAAGVTERTIREILKEWEEYERSTSFRLPSKKDTIHRQRTEMDTPLTVSLHWDVLTQSYEYDLCMYHFWLHSESPKLADAHSYWEMRHTLMVAIADQRIGTTVKMQESYHYLYWSKSRLYFRQTSHVLNLGTNWYSHNEMVTKNYAYWLKPMLIPNLPSTSFWSMTVPCTHITTVRYSHHLNIREELFMRR
jgi:hypothetical protein